MTDVQVSVYVIGYKGDRWLPSCISSLAGASELRIHLVLIDNVDNACIPDLDLSAFDAEIVSTPRPMGFADAHNFGIVAAAPRGEFVVLLNQDTISHRGWIDACANAMKSDSRLGILSPGLRTYDDQAWDPHFAECMQQAAIGKKTLDASTGVEHAPRMNVTGAAMMARTALLKDHGLFDPIFGSYYEDYDFCQRAWRAGWSVAAMPTARVMHFSGSATTDKAAEDRRTTWVLRNRAIYGIRNETERRGRFILGLLLIQFPRRAIRALLKRPSSQPMACVLSAWLSLTRMLPRLWFQRNDLRAWQRHLDELSWAAAFDGGGSGSRNESESQ